MRLNLVAVKTIDKWEVGSGEGFGGFRRIDKRLTTPLSFRPHHTFVGLKLNGIYG
jgi:hypothetical protein